MASLQLEIVTPDSKVLSTLTDYVSVPGLEGEFGVLPGHIPFLSALAVGTLHYKTGNTTRYVFISGGFAEVSGDKVSILAESAEEAEHIDFDRAQRARERAEQRINAKEADVDIVRAQAALQRSICRLGLRSR